MEKLVLIDGNSLLNRAFFATKLFATKDGRPTNAIYGFTRLLLKILDDTKPEYILVAFDMKAPTFRHEMYDGYKAGRAGMPEELVEQLTPLKDLLAAMKIATCEKSGIEADDIIGTLSHRFDVHSYIYTGDRDAYQLVDERTDVYFTKRGVSDLMKLSVDNFVEQVGLNPGQIIDLKALMGDESDNIPGVPGIGEKTARQLLEKYETLDGVYSGIDEMKGSLRQKLLDGKDSAYLSRTLATIRRDCAVDVELKDLRTPGKFNAEVRKLFYTFEFRSLLQLNIFDDETEPYYKFVYPEKIVCKNSEEIKKNISKNSLFVEVDINRIEVFDGEKMLSLKKPSDLFDGMPISEYVDFLRFIFEDARKKVVLYDGKKTMHVLSEFGISMTCCFDDVGVMAYLSGDAVEEDLQKKCEGRLMDYNFSAFCLKIFYDEYSSRLTGELKSLYQDIELPLVSVLFNMESAGVGVDMKEMDSLSGKYNSKLSELSEQIFELCGCTFNINSPSQLGDVLFNKLGLKTGKKNKRGYSTDAETLESLAGESEVVRLILKYRQYGKLQSTYIEGFRPLVGNDGKIHTTYNQTVTATGRLSSTNPNMQNIPVRGDEGREVRRMFVSTPGSVFIDADYSQIELRLLAHFSGCRSLIEAYNEGKDIHAFTASQVFGVPTDEVTPTMRRDAKAVNFGIIYGISEYGLSRNLGIPVATARQYIDDYFAKYPEVKEYMDSNVAFAKEHGYVNTLTGRQRLIPELKSPNYSVRQFGERAAMNMPLQGTSADIIKMAMVNVCNAMAEAGLNSRLILQVHDELIVEAPKTEASKAAEILKNEMEGAVRLSVPLTVETHIGANLYDAK